MATAFNPETYLKQDAAEIAQQFLTLKKKDLMALGQHFKLEVKIAMRRAQLQEVVLEQLVEEDIIEDDSVEITSVDITKADSTALEIRKLELQQELELKRLGLEQEKLVAEERAS